MKNEFDNNLTDKGWRSMRRLLDREMPEQRSRRRFAWWWFVLLLLPLVGAGGWWVLRDSKPEKINPPTKEVPKVSEPVVEAVEEQNFWKVEPTSSDDSKASDELPATSLRLVKTPSGDVANGQNLENSNVTLGENIQRGGENLTTFQKLSNLNELPAIPQFVENEIKNTPKLSTVTPFTASITKKNPEPKRWSFGLAAGLASEKFSSINGFSAGAAVDWQFARKWGLRSGLQYVQHRISGQSRPVVSLAALEYVNATGNQDVLLDNSGSPVTSPSTTPSTVAVPVERLRQLEIPMLAFWQPVRPLRVFGGLSMNYTFSAKASAESYANNTSYFADSKQAQNNLNELATSNLRHWQTNLLTGLGVRLGKRFELDAFYQYGTPDPRINTDSGTFDPTTGGTTGEIIGQRKGATHNFLLNGILFF